MHTNLDDFGESFGSIIDKEIEVANNVAIAVGYSSLDTIYKYRSRFLNIAKLGGTSKLLLGMAFYEGLGRKKLETLQELNNELQGKTQDSGVYVCHVQRFHGKIYHFQNGASSKIYVGSSNFSLSGLKKNIECTIPVEEPRKQGQILDFLEHLYSSKLSVKIDKADINIIGETKIISSTTENKWDKLERYSPRGLALDENKKISISLLDIVNHEKSNLNTYFGKGRVNSLTGKTLPRPWYEIEIIPRKSIRMHPDYPRGDFLAFTDDGLIIPMKTQGDNYKNLRSRSSLQIFGRWLKGKLEDKKCLGKYQLITLETLEEYGKNSLLLYKIEDGKYYMSF